jgi:DNA-binding HxlR family transcriptional regulator
MSTSELIMYIDIAKLLVKGPQTLHQLTTSLEAKESVMLKQRLDFLVSEGLIEKRTTSPEVTYNLAEAGRSVLTYFNLLTPSELNIAK